MLRKTKPNWITSLDNPKLERPANMVITFTSFLSKNNANRLLFRMLLSLCDAISAWLVFKMSLRVFIRATNNVTMISAEVVSEVNT